MNYEDIKRHFEHNPAPKEVEWTPWAKITDTQVFLLSCYATIRNSTGPLDRCPAWWHLRDFYILMKKTVQQTAQQNTEKPAGEEPAGASSTDAEAAL
ncbi:hypothetical protein [Flavobacterium sp. DG2-3]|uniref:DUF6965 family protein n=1 Tax=Flavobacterium sp. DG2-3 TaxID=3068317 RepID=UPI00273F6688|nr:hypothetical protein [Flavobacterium sp. DG2-3]MDP5200338.1 hypothetical protein [Flavobacterium sp. DG2-3]